MGILRKDYILDRWVYYATERRKRPMEFKKEHKIVENKTCFFCPGNEHLTPPEIGRVEYKKSWKIRWFQNKFPSVELKGKPGFKTREKFLTEGTSFGVNEIIVETPDRNMQLWDLSVDYIKQLLEVYALRINKLSKIKGIKYVAIFKNHGPMAGASLMHSHTQVAAIPIIPQQIMEAINSLKKFKKCPYCSIIKLESKHKRKIAETKNVIAFCPFASRFNYEAWIFPKNHFKNITYIDDKTLHDIAKMIKKILFRLKKINSSYNLFLHYSPIGKKFHFHIEITPRVAKWGGFEFSTGAVINSILPEDAARFYRSR